jgi:hypothetical protein
MIFGAGTAGVMTPPAARLVRGATQSTPEFPEASPMRVPAGIAGEAFASHGQPIISARNIWRPRLLSLSSRFSYLAILSSSHLIIFHANFSDA